MFLNRANVRRHIAASKPCRLETDGNMGIREILLEARAGDVMAGGGGAAGPAPDVRHQPAGDVQAEILHILSIRVVIPGIYEDDTVYDGSFPISSWEFTVYDRSDNNAT
jgi:hypothetical protein